MVWCSMGIAPKDHSEAQRRATLPNSCATAQDLTKAVPTAPDLQAEQRGVALANNAHLRTPLASFIHWKPMLAFILARFA